MREEWLLFFVQNSYGKIAGFAFINSSTKRFTISSAVRPTQVLILPDNYFIKIFGGNSPYFPYIIISSVTGSAYNPNLIIAAKPVHKIT
ncbi:MAG: hypothetical protein WKF59_25920, partial [Chitinophagaceae bacterium]